MSLGKRARSISSVRYPLRASNSAVDAPAQRAPMMIASYIAASLLRAQLLRQGYTIHRNPPKHASRPRRQAFFDSASNPPQSARAIHRVAIRDHWPFGIHIARRITQEAIDFPRRIPLSREARLVIIDV